MDATLIYRAGPGKRGKLRLVADVTRVGRKSDNDLVLENDIVSGTHAEIHRKSNGFLLLDLESTNGTFVNGKAIRKVELRDGDRIAIGEGGPELEFRCSAVAGKVSHRLHPISGMWKKGMMPVSLEPGATTIGRSVDNDLVAGRSPASVVSNHHAVIVVQDDCCEIRDLDSSNGTFVNGQRIQRARLADGDRVELGIGGPVFELRLSAGMLPRDKASARHSEQILLKLQMAAKGGRAGEQTMMLLHAANRYYMRKRRPLLLLSGTLLAVALLTGYFYYRKYEETRRTREQAEEIFYRMRALAAQLVQRQGNMSAEESDRLNNDRIQSELAYDRFLNSLGVYEGKTEAQKAIMRLARHLGETDLEVPPDFYDTTLAYVEKWRSTTKLKQALDRARERGLLQIIRKALDQHGLPQEFLFIPLQESSFDAAAVGLPTSQGIAKGMWQLIPATALEYHLRLGPLKDVRQPDPSDQRHDELASTQAAVRYLAYLFSTKAAASSLLVMASYNYGQTRIIKKLDSLPNDPRQRNFWNFYRKGWLPDETRNYVMSVFSAALVCERPDLFRMNIEPIMPRWSSLRISGEPESGPLK